MPVRIQTRDFDAGAEIAALRRGDPKIGAVASFIGVCRDANDGEAVKKMTLEHYPGMTEKAIGKIISEARREPPTTRQRSAGSRPSRAPPERRRLRVPPGRLSWSRFQGDGIPP